MTAARGGAGPRRFRCCRRGKGGDDDDDDDSREVPTTIGGGIDDNDDDNDFALAVDAKALVAFVVVDVPRRLPSLLLLLLKLCKLRPDVEATAKVEDMAIASEKNALSLLLNDKEKKVFFLPTVINSDVDDRGRGKKKVSQTLFFLPLAKKKEVLSPRIAEPRPTSN